MNKVKVSIIIPTHKREKPLIRSFKSVVGLNYPKNKYEIIIVSDSGTDFNNRVENAISKKLNELSGNTVAVRFLKFTKRIGAAKARNMGLKVANGEVIAFIDDDVIVHKDWLKNLINAYNYGANIGGVGGRIGKDSFNEVSNHALSVGIIGWGGHTYFNFNVFRRCKVNWVRGCNMSFRKTVLDEVGGFDEALGDFSQGDDIDLCLRIRSASYDIIYEPTAVVLHKEAPLGGVRSQAPDLAYWYIRNSTYIFLKLKGPKKFVVIPRRFIAILSLCIRRTARSGSASLFMLSKILAQATLGLTHGIILKMSLRKSILRARYGTLTQKSK